jgi:hypothetical protein
MKSILVFSFALLILASCGTANQLCATGGGLDMYIANYTGFSNACQIGDKLFYNFAYSASSTPAGNQPGADETSVIPDPGDGFTNPGMIFSVGGFLVFPGETMDATITYSISTLSGSAVMEDYDLIMAGSHTGANTGGLGFGSVTESFTNAPVGSPLITTVVGPPGSGVNSAHVNFLPWVNGTTVTTKIHLESPSTGPFDLVTISAIQEHFSEAIPEPYESILIGSGLLVFGLFRKRVKYSSN